MLAVALALGTTVVLLTPEGGVGVLARLGRAPAQYRVARMYQDGTGGVPEDDAEAVKWYRQAADQGHADAQFTLGDMYLKGAEGVPQDFVEAYAWFNVAAASGDSDVATKAASARNRVANRLTPSQIVEAQRRSHELFPHE